MITLMRILKITLIALLCLTGLFLILGLTSSNLPWDHKQSANEAMAISQMRTMMSAQELYHERHGRILPSVQALVDANYLSKTTLDREHTGYVFTVKPVSQDAWEVTAAPATPGVTGRRWFYVTSLDGDLRMKWYEPADSGSCSLKTGKGDANGPGFMDNWVYCHPRFLFYLLMAFRTGVVTFCVFVLYMFLKVLGVGQRQDETD